MSSELGKSCASLRPTIVVWNRKHQRFARSIEDCSPLGFIGVGLFGFLHEKDSDDAFVTRRPVAMLCGVALYQLAGYFDLASTLKG